MARRRNEHARKPARLNHLMRMEDALNEDFQAKVTEFVARYHNEYIGTSTDRSVEDRLRLMERLSVKWWIATGILWLRDRAVLLAARFRPAR